MINQFNSDLWTPGFGVPPQVTPDAQISLLNRVIEEGIQPMVDDGLRILREESEPYAEYIDRFGFTLNQLSAEGFWPDKALKIGASLGMLAYRESGYFEAVDDDAFLVASERAKTVGIPEAYTISLIWDGSLINVLDGLREAPDISETAIDVRHWGGQRQIIEMGAGCTRHYLQQALVA